MLDAPLFRSFNIVFPFQSHGSKGEFLVVVNCEDQLEIGDLDSEGSEQVSGAQVGKSVVFLL